METASLISFESRAKIANQVLIAASYLKGKCLRIMMSIYCVSEISTEVSMLTGWHRPVLVQSSCASGVNM